MTRFKRAERIRELPPYLFAEIDRLRKQVAEQGVDLIDLGVGDPDLPTPAGIVSRAAQAVSRPGHHHYPSYEGMLEFRQAAAAWMERRFGVDIDPQTEVISLIGSKEGLAHLPLAYINPGDLSLVPSPSYPVYSTATLFAGGESFFLPLLKENQFLPDLSVVPEEVRKRAKLLFINYPNNPTTGVADGRFFERVVDFARSNDLIVCHDAAYCEVYYDGKKPPGFLQVPGAKDVGVEFHSLSKTFNMTGWRIGFVCGNAEVVEALGKVKTNIDSGVFQAIQEVAAYALANEDDSAQRMRQVYQQRRDILQQGIKQAGLEMETPSATFYLWVSIPPGSSSAEFATHLLEKAGIVATPGNGFGQAGEGYIRLSLTVATERVKEAAERISRLSF